MRNRNSRSRGRFYGGVVVALALAGGAYTAASAQQWATSGNNIYNTNSGNVGVGTTTPVVKLDVGGWTGMPGDVAGALANFGGVAGGDAFYGNTGAGTGRMRLASNANQGFIEWNMYYTGAGLKAIDTTKPGYELDMNASSDSLNFRRYPPSSGLFGAPLTIMYLGGNGRVGIGTTAPAYKLDVAGTIRATQVIGAVYQDFAEWVPAATKMTPGTVVVLNPEAVNQVMPSTRAYDTTVAGVVSENPGVILGEAADNKAQIATTGRVRVHVDATHSPIGVGDLLVTGDKTGTAIKSVPIEIAGRKFHQPGTIVGKALEPLARGQGDILVLLSLQ